MNRSKLIAIITGAIAIALSLAYLIIVQLLDFRGEMLPAPIGVLPLCHDSIIFPASSLNLVVPYLLFR